MSTAPGNEATHERRPLALVTGASSGIGLELARCCAEDGYDLMIAADDDLDRAAQQLRRNGAVVHTVQADLATMDGVDRVLAALRGRAVDALLANAGHGLGKAFLDQDFQRARHVVDTNITGTLRLIQEVGRGMRERRRGRILITGSIAGFMPGSYQAVYNGSKAFLDSFAYALRNELKDSGVTVTCLMPGATDTRFFERADMLDTQVATGRKDDPADVARSGYRAMLKGKPGVVTGLQNKLQVGMTRVATQPMLAQRHRTMAAPGTGAPRQTGNGALSRSALMVGGVVLAALAVAVALQPRPRQRLVHATRQLGRQASVWGQRAGGAAQRHVARLAREAGHALR
jgi:short-subunit dehydrogenase